MLPHEFWQEIHAPGTFASAMGTVFRDAYPATLPDGRQIALPIRVLPGGTDRAVASLILNQASFAVVDAIADVVAARVAELRPEIIVAMPTLGLTLGEAVARRLGHSRLVPLGTSRKYWYDEALSVPLSSITSPKGEKRLYVDPRMIQLLAGQRVVLVDDVLSTGSSIAAALSVLSLAGCRPVAIAAAMLQGERWQARLREDDISFVGHIIAALSTPILSLAEDGWISVDRPQVA